MPFSAPAGEGEHTIYTCAEDSAGYEGAVTACSFVTCPAGGCPFTATPTKVPTKFPTNSPSTSLLVAAWDLNQSATIYVVDATAKLNVRLKGVSGRVHADLKTYLDNRTKSKKVKRMCG